MVLVKLFAVLARVQQVPFIGLFEVIAIQLALEAFWMAETS